MRIDKDKLKEDLTINDIEVLLSDFEFDIINKDDNTLIMRTLCHNHSHEDASHKLYYYDDNKTFMCYTECGGFDIYELIIKLHLNEKNEEINFYQSIAYVMNKLGFSNFAFLNESEYNSEDLKILEELNNILYKEIEKKEDKELNEYEDFLIKNLPLMRIKDWELEGISFETIKKFDIRYHPTYAKIVIPHYDANSRLIGIRGRALIYEEAEKYGKYMPLITSHGMFNHPLGFNLYGLNMNKKNIQKGKIAIVFESEKSVMLAEEYLPQNFSVAVCGSNMSDYQMKLLTDLGVTEVVFAFDRQYKEYGDDECIAWINKIKKIADRYKNYVSISVMFDKQHRLGYKDAPIDCGKEVFLELFKERIEVR